LLSKEIIAANIYIAEKRQPLPLETFYLWTKYPKVPQSATLRKKSETEELMEELQELMPQLSDTVKMALKLDSDYHQEPEKPSPDIAEPQSVLLPLEEELINPY